MDLTSKVALITGGARGMGKAYAKAIIESGGKVSLLDVLVTEGEATANEFQEQFGIGSTKFIKCDITNDEELEKAFRETKEYFGRLDIVVNNAAVWKDGYNYVSLVIDTNLTALIKGTYLGFDYLRKENGGQGGVIVNVASIAALAPMKAKGLAVYSASKYGVLGFTRCLAVSIGEPSSAGHGVKIVCLSHGPVDTVLLRDAMEGDGDFNRIIQKNGCNEESTVVAAFLKMLSDTNNHGGVMKVTPQDGIVYVFPEHLILRTNDIQKLFCSQIYMVHR